MKLNESPQKVIPIFPIPCGVLPTPFTFSFELELEDDCELELLELIHNLEKEEIMG